jgi:hypothetical protein
MRLTKFWTDEMTISIQKKKKIPSQYFDQSIQKPSLASYLLMNLGLVSEFENFL